VEVFDWCLANDDKYHWDFVQIQMNYVDWHNAKEQNPRNVNSEYLYTELVKRGIPAVIMEPLLGGRLSKLPMHVINHLKQRRPQDSAASWAFRFCGTYPGVMTALSGMTYMEHLQDNLRTYSPLEPLSQEDLDYLENTAKLILCYPTIPCNDCQYCMPCPYGINIPAILLHYNKLVNEGAVPQDQEDPNYRQLRKQYLISYDRTIPAIRQADHCIGCGKCQSHCPQNIRIPQQLERIAKRVEELRKNIL
jgi:predicted aldo/keto reductase-like oxidoreductase